TDMMREACALIETVQALVAQGQKTTLLQLTDIFRGSKSKRIMDRGDNVLSAYGLGKALTRGDADRLCQHLVLRQVLDEYCENNAAGYVCTYVRLGPAANRVSHGQLRVSLQLTDPKLKKTAQSDKPARAPRVTKQASTTKASSSSKTSASASGASYGAVTTQAVFTRDTSTHFGGRNTKSSNRATTAIKPMLMRGSRP
ncbi:ATP-dependent DNA helicase sgs1, partial [Coemansia sp. RSA 2673]